MSNDGENGEVQSQPNIFSDIYNYTKAPFVKVQISLSHAIMAGLWCAWMD